MQKEFVKHDGKGDMVHGIFTTALARLKLLRKGLLKKNEKHPETGRLRELYISAFNSGGPKIYGLEICWCNEDSGDSKIRRTREREWKVCDSRF